MLILGKSLHIINSDLSTYLTYREDSYWDKESERWLQLNLSGSLSSLFNRVISYSLTYSSSLDHRANDRSIFLNVSIPFGQSDAYSRVSTTVMKHGNQLQTGMEISQQRFNPDLYWNVGAYKNDSSATLTGNISRQFSAASTTLFMNYEQGIANDNQDNFYVSGTVRGGITAVKNHLIFHHAQDEALAQVIVNTNKAKNISFNNGNAISDNAGMAVLANQEAYQKEEVNVDINHLPENAYINDPIKSMVMTKGAIGYRTINVTVGSQQLIKLRHKGQNVPFGANVYDAKNRLLSMVSGDGMVYLVGIQPNASFTVKVEQSHILCQFTLQKGKVENPIQCINCE